MQADFRRCACCGRPAAAAERREPVIIELTLKNGVWRFCSREAFEPAWGAEPVIDEGDKQ